MDLHLLSPQSRPLRAPQPSTSTQEVPAKHLRALRIGVVTETYPPDVNGAALTLKQVVSGLRARGHSLQLVRLRQDANDAAVREDQFDELLRRGVPSPRYPQLKMGLPSRRALQELWARPRPDLIHIATPGPLGWSALQAAEHHKLPVCAEFRTNFHACIQHCELNWLSPVILRYLRWFHNRMAFTMVPTDKLCAELQALGFERLKVVGRRVDTALFSPDKRSPSLRERWGAGPQATVAIHVGRLAPEKNLETLIDAFAAIRQTDPQARCVVVGDGPQRSALQASCPETVFVGMQTGEDLAQHYASADLFVYPSLTETLGQRHFRSHGQWPGSVGL